jgi:hypothetical protein
MAAGRRNEPWDKQPGESDGAWRAFLLYRDLVYQTPPRKRRLATVAEELGKGLSWMKKRSMRYSWVERCREYDSEMQRMDFEEKKAAIKEMQKQHVLVAKALQKKALKALAELPQESLTAKNILDYIVQGIEMERRVRVEMAEAAAPHAKGGILADIENPEQSTMMQLVHSIEHARNNKKN